MHRLTNWLHSLALFGGMLLLLGALGWSLGGADLMVLAALLGLPMLVAAPRLAHRFLRRRGAYPLAPHQAPGLYRILEELARRAGLAHRPCLYYLPIRTAGAFTVGHRREAAIVLTQGLVRRLNQRELAGVLAHEISHVRSNDVWVMGLADFVARMTGAMARWGGIFLLFTLPIILLTPARIPWLALLLMVVAPGASALLQMALSRTREFAADRGAATLTGDPTALATALRKLEYGPLGLLGRLFGLRIRRPEPPPLLRTHPPTEERIDRLMRLAR